MAENKFDMTVITTVNRKCYIACSRDERNLEDRERGVEGVIIPVTSYEREIVFDLSTIETQNISLLTMILILITL